MRKYNSLRCIILLLFTVVLIFFSFKNFVYSNSDSDTEDIALENNPRGIAINPETNIAVIAVQKDKHGHHHSKHGYASIVDLNTQTILSTISVGKKPRGVAIDRGLNLAVITNSHDNTASIIDLSTNKVTATIPAGKDPQGIAINQTTHRAYVTNHKDDTISVIDLFSRQNLGTIPVGKEPKDIAIDPILNLALVVNEKEHVYRHKHGHHHKEAYTVSVIDLNTYQITDEIPVGKKPQAIAINPETHLAAVVNEKDNSITVINLSNWQTTTIPVGKHPIAIAINQLDNRALVTCDEDNDEHKNEHKHNHGNKGESLLVIDLNTNTIIKNYSINKKTRGIAVNNFTNIAAVIDDKTDSLTLTQLPNPVPEITSITPAGAQRGSDGIILTIEGNKFITSSVAYFNSQSLSTAFTDNHQIRITVPKEMLANAGVFPVAVVNPLPEGGASNSPGFTVNNPIPSITVIEPVAAMAGTQSLTLTIYGAGFFNDTEIYFGNTKKPITYINNTKLQTVLTAENLKTAGQYEIKAYNLPPGGGNSNKLIFTVKPPLEIKITSPIEGETINKSKTIVKGTIKTDTKDLGIKVNGILAEISGNEWTANNIPLGIGTNTITATATDSQGNTDTKTITVNTNDITQKVELSANITSGIPHLQVFFSASISVTPASYQMDFEGDGVIDYTGTTFENISRTYTTEGIFYPTVTVTDEQGNTYSDTIAITVLSKTEIDALLKGKWEGMKGALAQNNINSVVNYFDTFSKDAYKEMFTALSSRLPQIVQELNDIRLIRVIENTAEYDIRTIRNGKEYSFYLLFVRDGNGLWKIRSF